MAIKAFFTVAALIAVTIGLLLPTPNGRHGHPTISTIETMDVSMY